METMDDLMLHFLQDIYYAEKRTLRSMQKMARAASEQAVKDAILQHREQTEHQISRLDEVFELMTGKRGRAKRCEAIEGLVAESDEAIEESKKGPVLDAALIAGAQAVEHYEIARYGAMVAWARQAGKEDVAELLQQTLDEEKQSDEHLTEIAHALANPAAAEQTEPLEDEPLDNEADAEESTEEAPETPKRGPGRRAAKSAEPEPEPMPARGRRASAAAKTATPRRGAKK